MRSTFGGTSRARRAGSSTGLGRALIGMVIADLYTSVSGIGYLIVRYVTDGLPDDLLVAGA
ncbi:MAG: hypothetical protein ACYDAB_08060 [bacterium]